LSRDVQCRNDGEDEEQGKSSHHGLKE
jgi:hypothetical protein